MTRAAFLLTLVFAAACGDPTAPVPAPSIFDAVWVNGLQLNAAPVGKSPCGSDMYFARSTLYLDEDGTFAGTLVDSYRCSTEALGTWAMAGTWEARGDSIHFRHHRLSRARWTDPKVRLEFNVEVTHFGRTNTLTYRLRTGEP